MRLNILYSLFFTLALLTLISEPVQSAGMDFTLDVIIIDDSGQVNLRGDWLLIRGDGFIIGKFNESLYYVKYGEELRPLFSMQTFHLREGGELRIYDVKTNETILEGTTYKYTTRRAIQSGGASSLSFNVFMFSSWGACTAIFLIYLADENLIRRVL